MSTFLSALDEVRVYSRAHLIDHLRGSGMPNDEIADNLARLPAENPDKPHYIQQFVNSLPPEDREEFSKRLGLSAPQ